MRRLDASRHEKHWIATASGSFLLISACSDLRRGSRALAWHFLFITAGEGHGCDRPANESHAEGYVESDRGKRGMIRIEV